MKEKIEKLLNEQISKEFYSSNLYLAMASWSESKGFEGVSGWLYAQAREENDHMLKFIRYLNERGGRAVIPSVEQPPLDFSDVHKMFKEVLTHEQAITESINQIVGACMLEGDFTTLSWVQWFVTEQIEEEASVSAILDKLHLMGDDKSNLYLFDKDIMALRAARSAGANA